MHFEVFKLKTGKMKIFNYAFSGCCLKIYKKIIHSGVFVLMEINMSKIFNPKTSKWGFCIKKVHLEVFELEAGKMEIFSDFSQYSSLSFSFDFLSKKDF